MALHLVNSPGSGDDEVAAFLAEEGESALEAGSIALATQLLRRALEEPAAAGLQPRILVALGRAEHALSRSMPRVATSRPRWSPTTGPSC